VFITRKKIDDVVAAAREVFFNLKLAQTTPHNSELLFLAPESQKLAIIGGTDLYQVLPPEWWSDLIATVTASFVEGRLAEGLFAALEEIGRAQRQHFPTEKPLDGDGQSDLEEEG